MNINNVFSILGFDEIDREIYLATFSNPSSTIGEIATRMEQNRTTIHQRMNRLIEAGIISQIYEGHRRKLVAEPLENIRFKITDKKSSFINLLDQSSKVVEELNVLYGRKSDENIADVRVYDGKKRVSKIYDEILESKEVRAYVDTTEIIKTFPENPDKFIYAAKNKDIELWDMEQWANDPNLKIFLDKCKDEGVVNYHHKFFPKDIKIGYMDYLIYSNSVAIVQGGVKPRAIIVESEYLYQNAKTIFDLLWRLLPETY